SIGVQDPALGPMEDLGSGDVQFTLHSRAAVGAVRTDVTRSTIVLHRLAGHWAVTGVDTDSIDYGSYSIGPSAFTVVGTGRGLEGTLHIQVIGHGDVDFRREAIATASGDADLRPYAARVDLTGWTGTIATVVIWNESGET